MELYKYSNLLKSLQVTDHPLPEFLMNIIQNFYFKQKNENYKLINNDIADIIQILNQLSIYELEENINNLYLPTTQCQLVQYKEIVFGDLPHLVDRLDLSQLFVLHENIPLELVR